MEAQDIEIMMGLLTPRATRVDRAQGSQTVEAERAVDASRLRTLVAAARNDFEQRGAAGNSVAAAVLLLAGERWDDQPTAGGQVPAAQPTDDEGRFEGVGDDEVEARHMAPFLHDLAVENLRDNQVERAAVFFATLLHLKTEEMEALSGLALCGVRLGQFEEALLLANECLKLPEKHPRAYCIAGFCELERGNRKAAQSLLALGARIARNRPEFAEDLRAAQRVLLILHFA